MAGIVVRHGIAPEELLAWRATRDDDWLLARATELGRVMFSQDVDLLCEAKSRQLQGLPFCGLVFGPQLSLTVGQTIHALELVAKIYEPADIAFRIEFLPL